jgi:hypothetical protein
MLTALLSLEASAATIQVPRQFFGMHDGSMQSYSHLHVGALRLWDAGVTWRDIETSPGVYDWSRLDALVTAAQSHGTEVTLVLGQTPAFYSSDKTRPPADLATFRGFANAVMSRYRDFNGARGIACYEVWNEGNDHNSWTGTPHQLALLTRVVARTRRLVDPDAVVVAPSFAVRRPSQRREMASYQAQRVAGRPVWRYYDSNAVSLYPLARYDDRIGGPEDSMRLLRRVRGVLAAVGVPTHKPVWATEINYGLTGRPTAATPISERQQVANVMRTYLLSAARGLARVFWYRYDWNTISGGGTLGNTLLSVPGSPGDTTAAGLALDTTEHWLHGALVGTDGHRPCHRDRRATYRCVVRHRDGVRTIIWNPRRTVTVPMPNGARYRQRGDGARVTLSPSVRTLRVSYLPVMVESRRTS